MISLIIENYSSLVIACQYQYITILKNMQWQKITISIISIEKIIQIAKFKQFSPWLFNSKFPHLPYSKIIFLWRISKTKTFHQHTNNWSKIWNFVKILRGQQLYVCLLPQIKWDNHKLLNTNILPIIRIRNNIIANGKPIKTIIQIGTICGHMVITINMWMGRKTLNFRPNIITQSENSHVVGTKGNHLIFAA